MDDRGAPKLSPRAVAWVSRLTDAGLRGRQAGVVPALGVSSGELFRSGR